MISSLFILIIGLLTMTGSLHGAPNGRPAIASQDGTFVGQVGESVTLPCEIRNPGRRSVFWFKGGSQEGRELVMQMKSVRGRFLVPRHFQGIIRSGKLGVSQSNLIINDLSPEDANIYSCSLAAVAGQTVTHRLEVRGGRTSPSRSSLVVEPTPQDGRISVGEGYPVTFTCNVPNSGALVSWQKVGSRDVLTTGPVLNIYSALRTDSGNYLCTAEDGVSAPASFTFQLTVEYVDVQAYQKEVFASSDDFSALLTCQIDGLPEPSLTWYDSKGPISPNDPRRRVAVNGKTHYLQLAQMTSADLGDYQCYGYNSKGRDRETIVVKGQPGPVRVLSADLTGYGSTFRFTWEVNSLAPINYYVFKYEKVGSGEPTQIVVKGNDPVYGSSTLYRDSTEVDLTPGETYKVMVNAIDETNNSSPDQTEEFTFTAPRAEVSGREEDAWKWWKMGLTVMSRLPQVARALQN